MGTFNLLRSSLRFRYLEHQGIHRKSFRCTSDPIFWELSTTIPLGETGLVEVAGERLEMTHDGLMAENLAIETIEVHSVLHPEWGVIRATRISSEKGLLACEGGGD